jgi:hypothetical protein
LNKKPTKLNNEKGAYEKLNKITAEFDTFDNADFVSRRISKRISGITKTSIQSRRSEKNRGEIRPGIMNTVSTMPRAYAVNLPSTGGSGGMYSVITPDYYSEERSTPEKTELTITCENSTELHRIEQMLYSGGAMNVKKT